MTAKFPFVPSYCFDEAGRPVGLEVRQQCGEGEEIVFSVTDQHPGAHQQVLAAGLKRVVIRIPKFP